MRNDEFEIMHREEDRHWWYVALHDLILRFVPRGAHEARILDTGCGTGRLVQLLQKRGAAEGCDISELALRFCAMRGVAVFKADLAADELGTERYDVITSIDVLYHRNVRDDAAILGKLRAALKPGGRLILQVPAYEWLRSSHDEAVHTARRYTRKQVVRMAHDCGFIVEKATYRVSILFVPIAIVRLIRKTIRACGAEDTRASDVRRHSIVVNTLLTMIMKAENRLLEYVSLAFGTSVFLVARKPYGAGAIALHGESV